MYHDIEDMPAPYNNASLENTPPTQSIPEQNDEASRNTVTTLTLNVI